MTLAERLHELAEAMERHAASGGALMPEDALAIAAVLHGEADAMTDRKRVQAMRGWQMRKAA